MIGKFSKSFQNYAISLTLVMITSLLVKGWGLFTMAPAIVKLLFSASIWIALVLYPWTWIKDNDFPKIGRFLLNMMLLWGMIEIIRSLFGSSVSSNGEGNKYITLFFNEYCSLIFIPPLYAYTVVKYNILSLYFNLTKKYFAGGIIVSIISLSCFSIAFLSVYIVTFWRYVTSKNRIIIVLVFIASFIAAIFGYRVFLIFILYSLAAYILCYKWEMRRLQKLACITSVFLPIVFFMPLLSPSAQRDDSYFKTILSYVTEKVGGDKDFSDDTRTFLYIELALDLTDNDNWILGKGAESSYYSSYFSKMDGDSSKRLTVEVPFLLFLLRGGLVYCFLYFSFILYCIYRAVWKGKSRFLNCFGIMLAGWFANLFVGDVSGCSFYHLVLFSLCGLTLSSKWIEMPDSEIKKLINTKNLIRI